eukprot:SAG11_NODE_91_length_17102_cov_37.671343_2_plen_669_part_00
MPDALAEIFVVVGLDEAEHSRSQIVEQVDSEGRLCDICTVCPNEKQAPPGDDWAMADKTPMGRSASVNFQGFMPKDIFLCCQTGCRDPITDIVVIYEDRGETVPEGYSPVSPYGAPGVFDLSQKSTERQVTLCYSRTAHKLPICQLVLVRKGEVPEGYELLERSLNIRSFGKDLFVAFVRAPRVCFTAKPTVIQQFPPAREIPGGDQISLFCMPTGVNIAHHYGPPLPTFFSFCLTVSEGQKMYGCCITFHEILHASVDEGHEGYSVGLYIPKCVCLLSHWPFFDAFREFLVLLFTFSQGPNDIPIERRLCDFLFKTPVPAYGTTTRILMESSSIDFVRPRSPAQFPLLDASMMPLFRCLDTENVLLLFKLVLLEHKIVLHSKHKSLLLPVAETLCAVIFPFKYQHVYIPVMPTALAEYLEAPVPYLIGMPTDEMDQLGVNTAPQQLTMVDLDNNTVTPGITQLPELPTHEEDVLRRELQLCASIYQPDAPDLENADLALAGGGGFSIVACFARAGRPSRRRRYAPPFCASSSPSSRTTAAASVYRSSLPNLRRLQTPTTLNSLHISNFSRCTHSSLTPSSRASSIPRLARFCPPLPLSFDSPLLPLTPFVNSRVSRVSLRSAPSPHPARGPGSSSSSTPASTTACQQIFRMWPYIATTKCHGSAFTR